MKCVNIVAMSDRRIAPVSTAAAKENGVHARTMLAAAEALGGLSELAAFFKVSRAELFRWAVGAERPPHDLFLIAVEVVLSDNDKLRDELKILPRATSGISLPASE